MAKETIKKLRDKSAIDLSSELKKEIQKLQELKFDLARGKVKNSASVRVSRKRIATLMTLLGEKSKASTAK